MIFFICLFVFKYGFQFVLFFCFSYGFAISFVLFSCQGLNFRDILRGLCFCYTCFVTHFHNQKLAILRNWLYFKLTKNMGYFLYLYLCRRHFVWVIYEHTFFVVYTIDFVLNLRLNFSNQCFKIFIKVQLSKSAFQVFM